MTRFLAYVTIVFLFLSFSDFAQPLGEPLRGSPGDEMIQNYLAQETNKLAAKFAENDWSLRISVRPGGFPAARGFMRQEAAAGVELQIVAYR
jgi:hypothetical protein